MIENQTKLDERIGSYGKYGSLSCDGAGAVAIKNICEMYEHTHNLSLEEIIEENKLGRGLFGTNPFKMRRALKRLGFNVKFRLRATERNMRGYSTFILFFYRREDIYCSGWHYTMGRQNEKGQIKTYNLLHFYKNINQFKEFERPFSPTMIFLIK